jgi:hypothetical protein
MPHGTARRHSTVSEISEMDLQTKKRVQSVTAEIARGIA